jgi:hypothetical protein
MHAATQPIISVELLERLHRTIDLAKSVCAEAADTVGLALALLGTTTAIREGALHIRCAWCGQYRFEADWVTEKQLPLFAPSRLPERTHTICPSCLAELRRTGQSV